MFERFSEGARQVVTLARLEAERMGHPYVGTEHLLLGVLGRRPDPAAAVLVDAGLDQEAARRAVLRLLGGPGGEVDGQALAAIGIDLAAVREAVEANFGAGALDPAPGPSTNRRRGAIRFTDRAKKTLTLALQAAVGRGSRRLEAGDLLLGLLREGGGLAVRVVRDAGLDPAEVERDVEVALG
ncbi:Clp protease N-terminal domain-containing protein [Kitasatospora sp. MBT63]|uniref:Clp protease N-terminal domain-containing protein n=1 Tax=Kitasatospora sp. MBT63 TaxID=1444768 RepID=UPI00053A46FE|nr:Clp protease N-terminal domain-containing protein [Kitasatospora sp. MBT63]